MVFAASGIAGGLKVGEGAVFETPDALDGIVHGHAPHLLGVLRQRTLLDEGVQLVSTPGVKDTRVQLDEDKELLAEKTTPYRAVVARANYLSVDRPDVQFASKEVRRWMSAPTKLSLNALKRLGR